MDIRLRIPGRETSKQEAQSAVRGGPLPQVARRDDTQVLDAVEVMAAFDLRPSARGKQEPLAERTAQDTDILEFVLDDGMSVWMSVAAYRERQRRLNAGATRSQALEINPLLEGAGASRGMADTLVADGLRLLRLNSDEVLEQARDPKQWPDWLKARGGQALEALSAWLMAKLIIWLIERKIRPDEGLYRWERATSDKAATLVSAEDIPANRPLLLFVHGTASNTAGSFGALHSEQAAPEWKTLVDTFHEHIYAFEHRTMSRSPIENALLLARALPAHAELTVVSHSRGGQVADLLCLQHLTDQQIHQFRRRATGSREADEQDQQHLRELAAVLKKKQFRIVRLLRVACPTRGTLLASGNTDRFLSVLTSLIGLIPTVGQSPLYQVAKRITLEVAKHRWDASVIPGIEAMIPESPLVALLNNPDAQANGELGVIAGDIEDVGWFKRLGTFITDKCIYDNQDNDLVVNTNSMFFGLVRGTDARYLFDQGSDVSHFRYFTNARTRALLVRSLTEKSGTWPPEFRLLEEAKREPVPMLRSIQTRSGASQPVVFVLPSIMGSELRVGGREVWPHYAPLFRGEIDRLAIEAEQVEAVGLVGASYLALCQDLADTHEVIPFGYDWRRSIRDAAAELGKAVSQVLLRTDQPIRFVAHGMGGLVVRRLIQDSPKLWETLCNREGGRFLMLGTPNRGSFDMVELMAGTAKTIRQLALLDVHHSLSELVGIVSKYPGALELLPQEEKWRYFSAQTWADLHPHLDSRLRIDSQALQRAKAALVDLPEQIPHAEKLCYVAGSAPRTTCGLSTEQGRLQFTATTAGDGRVTYKAGILPDVPVWYVEAVHGELPSHKPAFVAYRELLERGSTSRLASTPLGLQRGGEQMVAYEPEPVLYPTPAEFEAGFSGKQSPRFKSRSTPALQVSVLHGDLRYISNPLLVSHYEGDTIAGAEKVVDELVGGALTHRYHLGRYPGRLGTVAVALAQPDDVQAAFEIQHGAIVIGLGKWGTLTPTGLAQAVHQGVIEYAVQFAQCHGRERLTDKFAGLTLNSLLIGSNTSANITVEDSVNAIARGVVLANRALREREGGFPIISHLQFVERYLDAAIDAVKSARRVALRMERELHEDIHVEEWLEIGRNGQKRMVPSSATGYWRRWTVSAVADPPRPAPAALPLPLRDRLRAALTHEPAGDAAAQALVDLALGPATADTARPHTLRFLALSDRARAEASIEETQADLIARLIERSIESSAFRHDTARTLFELLIPLDLKDSLRSQDRVVFVVDAVTANYPWELLVDFDQPLCIRMGLIRQLELDDYEERLRDATSPHALVVGDPMTPERYSPLPGAQKEAELVASLLSKDQQFVVAHSVERLDAMAVLNQLFAQPYRVIHIAGHGYYSEAALETPDAKSGVVLSDGLFLTAAEIAKLDPLPELVFLNCCYLGQIDGRPTTTHKAHNKLAASVARELIRKGVRAVVAAGWPVRDDAALCFAGELYRRLLDAQPFGMAILEARKQTWKQFSDSNTWGAYQAYGDPDFRLVRPQEGSSSLEQLRPAAAEEILIALQTVASSPSQVDDEGRKTIAEQLEQLERRCAPAWLSLGGLHEQFGVAYGNHELFQEAVTAYARGASCEASEHQLTLRGVEQWINLEARLGKKQRNGDKIRSAITRGTHLLEFGKTAERLSIMGSAYKRLAEVLDETEKVREALVAAAGYYRQAVEHQANRPLPDPYPILNWLALNVILDQTTVSHASRLSEAESLAKQRFRLARSVWDMFALPDIAVIRACLNGTVQAQRDSLIDTYRQVFDESGASSSQQDSAVGQLRFIAAMRRRLHGATKQSDDAMAGVLIGMCDELKPKGQDDAATTSKTPPPAPSTRSPAKASGKTGRPRTKPRSPRHAKRPATKRTPRSRRRRE